MADAEWQRGTRAGPLSFHEYVVLANCACGSTIGEPRIVNIAWILHINENGVWCDEAPHSDLVLYHTLSIVMA